MIYKRGKFHWYRFMWDGKLIRKSTRQGNGQVARNMESAHRTSLAKGEVGIREKKQAPTLAGLPKRNSCRGWKSRRVDLRRHGSITETASDACQNLRASQVSSWTKSAAHISRPTSQGASPRACRCRASIVNCKCCGASWRWRWSGALSSG